MKTCKQCGAVATTEEETQSVFPKHGGLVCRKCKASNNKKYKKSSRNKQNDYQQKYRVTEKLEEIKSFKDWLVFNNKHFKSHLVTYRKVMKKHED